jgi:hypothetical protein
MASGHCNCGTAVIGSACGWSSISLCWSSVEREPAREDATQRPPHCGTERPGGAARNGFRFSESGTSFRAVMSKRGLWTLEAVLGQIAVLSPQRLAQQRWGRRPTASAFNKSRTLFMGVKFLVPGNGDEQHAGNWFSAI